MGGVEMNRAVFFDVDGTIRHNNTSKEDGCCYCFKYDNVEYTNGIFEAHRFLQNAGYKIFWVTMQNCIKDRLIAEDQVSEILVRMVKDFKDYGIHIEDYQICMSSRETDESKSLYKSYGVNKLSMIYNIDNSKSIGIGDRKHDVEAYKLSGIGTTIQALNLYGDEKCDADYYYSNNHHIANLDSLIQVLRVAHGCNDIPNLIRVVKKFHHVKKVWGDEYWITNSNCGNYCSKILVLQPDHISSLHYHIEKCESFTVLAGIVKIKHQDSDYVFINGDSILINAGDRHRFEAIDFPAVLLETSTFHDDEDTYRIEESK